MRALFLLATLLVAVAADSGSNQRIVGGTLTTINQYPFSVALLYSPTGSGNFFQSCGGFIINARTVVTSATCLRNHPINRWRLRVGSSFANSGGFVLTSGAFILHPQYNPYTENLDVGIIRSSSNIPLSNVIQAARIAGANYNLGDNQAVWTIGWGRQYFGGPPSEQLRHVQIWTVNQAVCRQRYASGGRVITDDMICSGWLDVGGRGPCEGDNGGPLLHNGVVVGISSWGFGCADRFYPGVFVRLSRVSNWIQANA